MNDRGTAYSDTTNSVHTGSADDGAWFRRAQSDEAP